MARIQIPDAEVQSALITVIANALPRTRLHCTSRGMDDLRTGVAAELGVGPNDHLEHEAVPEAFWSLVRQGLIYFNPVTDDQRRTQLDFALTKSGQLASSDPVNNPDHAARYLDRLREIVPEVAGTVVFDYMVESHRSYRNECYLASVAMLGGAGEVAFLEMAKACVDWLPKGQGDKLRETIESRRSSMFQKHEAFQNALNPWQADINAARPGLGEDLNLTMNVPLDVIRLGRNDVMHPYQRSFDRITTASYLQSFVFSLRRMYDLKDFFDTDQMHRGAATTQVGSSA